MQFNKQLFPNSTFLIMSQPCISFFLPAEQGNPNVLPSPKSWFSSQYTVSGSLRFIDNEIYLLSPSLTWLLINNREATDNCFISLLFVPIQKGKMGNTVGSLIHVVQDTTEKAHYTDSRHFLLSLSLWSFWRNSLLCLLDVCSSWSHVQCISYPQFAFLVATLCWFNFRGPRIGFPSQAFLNKVSGFPVNTIPSDFSNILTISIQFHVPVVTLQFLSQKPFSSLLSL